ncbi:MerR family transcriptional regulator [Paenibacillus psychroresistens]|uniref:MerR family transcriptional regulator n=1 Tax=Paenibacillus psychroresistens TaxID=1778678 RepID=A0A6B8REV0_9BACL|nr:MerR family transcriptional regulator [Paenibacillus psychroresistens]QGQ94002.1 MerR family transcriptional regulator [Paenibacillus psychroresistens]
MKGIEIAKKLNISTSALRHYEAWGIVPRIERAANGYRIYTDEHEAYFQCIRAMYAGFGMSLIREVMPHIINGEKLDALWLINKAQIALHTEKETVQRTVEILDLKQITDPQITDPPKYLNKKTFTIGEAATIANTSASSIRHWEKEGLIDPERHYESGFRIYSPSDIRKLLIIRTVQRVAYSLDIVREVLLELDKNDVAQAKGIALKSLQYIDYTLVEQVRGIASLHHLFEVISSKQN